MENVEKLKFPALKIIGDNYISWVTNIEIHLESDGLSETIKEGNTSSTQEKAKAIIFLRKHLDENVMHDYAHIKDPAELWQALKERFDNQREIILPHAMDEWANLRFQDFKTVEEYNSTMLRITADLKACGKPVSEADMIEKTYLTFDKSHFILQEQYRNRGYKKFSELYVALKKAQINSTLLIKNHNARPAGTKAIPEVNVAVGKYPERYSQTYRGRGRRFNRGRGRYYNPQGRKPYMGRKEEFPRRKEEFPRRKEDFPRRKDEFLRRKEIQRFPAPTHESICYKCGSKGHWFKMCRTPEHLCKLYRESQKGKEKEVNLMEHLETHLHGSDFASGSDSGFHIDE